MVMKRRHVLQALPGLPIIAVAGQAAAATTDLVLNCDTALGPPMAAAAARYQQRSGIRVIVFPTGPGLILPQLARQVQNDLVCTTQPRLAEAVSTGLVDAGAPRGAWRNRLVIAARAGAGADAAAQRVAVSDPTPGSDMDGPAILRALGLTPATQLGVIDTDEVAWLLGRGEADAGLLHRTDLHATPGLTLLRPVPDGAAPPIVYSISITKLARRPHPERFVDFVMGPEGHAVLLAHGLEVVS